MERYFLLRDWKNVVRISILLKTINRYNAIPIKITKAFHRNETNNSKICIEPQKTPNSQSNLEKGEQR